MGADLYINSIYQKQCNRYQPKFKHWVSVRDTYKNAGKKRAAQKAQEKVVNYFNKMNDDAGYFRDSYNNTNLLWLFDLSWWNDIGEKLIDREGNLGPDNIKQFIQMLSDRESVFKANLEKVELIGEDTREDARRYFGEKYARLKQFLNRQPHPPPHRQKRQPQTNAYCHPGIARSDGNRIGVGGKVWAICNRKCSPS